MTTFPVTHSILAPEGLVRGVLGEYEIGAVRDCRFYTHNLSDTYFVWAERGRYALRVYRAGWRTDEQIKAELDAIERIAGFCEVSPATDERVSGAVDSVAVSRSVVGRDGERLRSVQAPEGRRQAVLFTYAPGKQDVQDEAGARLYGRGVGLMHKATDGWRSEYEDARAPIDMDELLERPLRALAGMLAEQPKARAFLEPLAERLRRRFAALPPERLDAGWCYGDFHGGNAAIEKSDGGQAITFFDFDLCGHGWRAFDVAVFRWGNTGGWISERKADARWQAFLEGYAEMRRLAAFDQAAVPLFVMLRQYWFLGLVVSQAAHRGHSWPLRADFFPWSIRMLKKWERRLDATA
jgi:Ser/Thr protein kinase RdoA (MazF antagonist)